MAKAVTTTINQFNGFHERIHGVEIHGNIDLPEYVPSEKIVVDLGRIARIARVGRLEHVRFGLSSETTTHQAHVSGVHGDGSATGVASASRTEIRSRHDISSPYGERLNRFPRGSATISINAAHSDLDDVSLRDHSAWAALIDAGMRDGLTNASKTQLMSPSQQRKVAATVRQAMHTTVAGVYYALTQDVSITAYGYAWLVVCDATKLNYKIIDRIIGSTDSHIDTETSLIKDFPLDRLAIVAAMARSKRLVTS